MDLKQLNAVSKNRPTRFSLVGREPSTARRGVFNMWFASSCLLIWTLLSQRDRYTRLASCRALSCVNNRESNIFLISKSYIDGWLDRDTVHENACRFAGPNGVADYLVSIDGNSPNCEKLVKGEISDGI